MPFSTWSTFLWGFRKDYFSLSLSVSAKITCCITMISIPTLYLGVYQGGGSLWAVVAFRGFTLAMDGELLSKVYSATAGELWALLYHSWWAVSLIGRKGAARLKASMGRLTLGLLLSSSCHPLCNALCFKLAKVVPSLHYWYNAWFRWFSRANDMKLVREENSNWLGWWKLLRKGQFKCHE